MSVEDFVFRALMIALAALIAIDTWFMWRRGERLRRELDETKQRVGALQGDWKE